MNNKIATSAERTLRRTAEEGMRLLAESTRDFAIMTMDAEGRISTWNQGAAHIFGYSETEALGQYFGMLFTPEDQAAGAPQQELERARRDGRAEDDRWHVRRDGSRVFCSGITNPLHEGGPLCGFGKIARDQTAAQRARAESEAALREEVMRRAEAQATSELKDEFLAVMSHELKNPLNLIQLNAELLSRMPEARNVPAVAKAAATIRKTVLSQAQIIDDLLDLSRVNTGKMALNRSSVDAAAVVRTIATALREDAEHKGLALALEVTEEPVLLDADPVRLEQVVWNLLNNALKFTPRGGRVDLTLAIEQGRVVLRVQDTGRGIAPEVLPHVFDMFKQADPGTTRRHGGLGIGLALVRSLVLAHDGQVEVTSEGLDHGSCFTVWLPLQRSATAVAETPPASPAATLTGHRALVVDDDQQAVQTLRELLALEGAEVVSAHSAADALAEAGRQGFSFILSDIAMPDMDGYQLIRALKAEAMTAGTPVIAVTGLGRPVDAKRAIAAGFVAHLKKPVTVDKLLQTLSHVLKG
ncbi:hybrid sensor histidine kinase/response regulator [Ideonella sp. BN130291]|uniref:hybrid sensor histidine kinase/response regulator n=1 Tax=Ideonella sp. BN130291 TaxID=3112940 RepID=UPI002E2580E7|nr:ATP-binding protein [Ideonella sp. BN130291]